MTNSCLINGVNSPSFKNALARAKRNADKEKYGIIDTVLDAAYEYYLTEEETADLRDKLADYCEKNLLYSSQRIETLRNWKVNL